MQFTDPNLPTTDERAFHTVCRAVARSLDGDIHYMEPVAEHREKNFSIVTITVRNILTSVVLNGNYPYLAFASSILRDANSISFIEWPAGAAKFRQCSDYTILAVEELAKPYSQVDISLLADAEVEQIKYWHPQTAGQVIFNFWD